MRKKTAAVCFVLAVLAASSGTAREAPTWMADGPRLGQDEIFIEWETGAATLDRSTMSTD